MSDFLPLAFKAGHFNISDQEKFEEALSLLKESLVCKGSTLFSGDNMLLWNKSYSFLRQEQYLMYVSNKLTPAIPKTIIWRTHVLDYFLKRSLNVEGEILELGVLKGATAKFLCDLNSEKIIDRRYILIDLFDWKSGDKHTAHEALKKKVYTKMLEASLLHINLSR